MLRRTLAELTAAEEAADLLLPSAAVLEARKTGIVELLASGDDC